MHTITLSTDKSFCQNEMSQHFMVFFFYVSATLEASSSLGSKPIEGQGLPIDCWPYFHLFADNVKTSSSQFKSNMWAAQKVPNSCWPSRQKILLHISSYPNSSQCWVVTSLLWWGSNLRPLNVRLCLCANCLHH